MTKKLLRSLQILGLIFTYGHGQWLIAQSATADSGETRPSVRPQHASTLRIDSYIGARQWEGSQADPAALGLAKTKVYQFRSVDCPGGSDTYVHDYDDGTAVGDFDYPNFDNAFYFRGTSYHPVTPPGPGTINGINSSGQMVGSYGDSGGTDHGFVYDGKNFTTLDVPGSTGTYAWEINDSGLIVGGYYDSKSVLHGFLDENGVFGKINFPKAPSTFATGINSSGEIVGYYSDSAGFVHGFLLSNGTYSSFDFPLAKHTFAFGINDAGSIAGTYVAGSEHGFVYSGGVFTQVDVPGAISTSLLRIKNNRNVVGYAGDSLDEVHGFIGK